MTIVAAKAGLGVKLVEDALLDTPQRQDDNRYQRQVVEKLKARQKHTGADEMMILNLGHTPSAIHRSTELIADAYGMPEDVGQPLP